MSAQWKSVVADLRAAMQEIEEARGSGDTPPELMTKVVDANRAMMSFPITSITMLAEKMELLVEQFGIDDLGNGDEGSHVYADIRRLAGVDLLSPWPALLATYSAARDEETSWDQDHMSPHFVGVDHEDVAAWRKAAEPISQDMWEKSERLMEVRCEAENALMAYPSPNAEAFALKYVIAHGNGRETDHWDEMLEAEAKRFSGRDA